MMKHSGKISLNRKRCFGCGKRGNLTRHHVLGNHQGLTIPLCRKCHDELENKPYANGMTFGKEQALRMVKADIDNFLSQDIPAEQILKDIRKYIDNLN